VPRVKKSRTGIKKSEGSKAGGCFGLGRKTRKFFGRGGGLEVPASRSTTPGSMGRNVRV